MPNDLNSVFMVGRVTAFRLEDNTLIINLRNSHSEYIEERSEYQTTETDYVVRLTQSTRQISQYIDVGMRIGVNGRLRDSEIIAYTIQFLDTRPRETENAPADPSEVKPKVEKKPRKRRTPKPKDPRLTQPIRSNMVEER